MSNAAAPSGRWVAVWRWLSTGRRGVRGSASYSAPYRKATRRGIPPRLWQVVRRRRAIELTPIIYLATAAIGVLVGVVWQLTIGVWWWIPAAAVLLAVWLVEATSAFWGGRRFRHPYSLRVELLRAISPGRGAEAMRSEDRARLAASGLPLFAPAEWAGRLSLGGSAGGPGGLTSVSISCTPAQQEGPTHATLSVSSERREHTDEQRLRQHLSATLAGELVFPWRFAGGSAEGYAAERRRQHERVGALEWHQATVRADGRDHPGWGIELDGVACRYAAVDGHWLSVRGDAAAVGLPLRRVHDPASITGW